MNLWQGIAMAGAAFFVGWFLCDRTKAGQFADGQVALQSSMLDYTASVAKAQKAEADRVIAAIAVQGAERAATVEKVNSIIREVERAPASQNCVRSPAIVAALAGLRQLAAPGAGDPVADPAP
jgi:hypothetical protein